MATRVAGWFDEAAPDSQAGPLSGRNALRTQRQKIPFRVPTTVSARSVRSTLAGGALHLNGSGS